MQLTINGQSRMVEAASTVADLLKYLQLETDRVVVELNREILSADSHCATRLQDGDSLELIQFVGGG